MGNKDGSAVYNILAFTFAGLVFYEGQTNEPNEF